MDVAGRRPLLLVPMTVMIVDLVAMTISLILQVNIHTRTPLALTQLTCDRCDMHRPLCGCLVHFASLANTPDMELGHDPVTLESSDPETQLTLFYK